MLEGLSVAIPANLDTLQLPDPILTTYWRLANQRIFYIDTDIDETVLDIQRNIMTINLEDAGIPAENRQPIILMISSPGGYLVETMELCQTILLSKTPVYTVNMGMAYSGAALILMAGHKRFAFPLAKAMVHSGSSGSAGTYEQQEAQQQLYKKQVTEMGQFILAHTTIDEKTYKKNRAKDWYMTDEEQVAYGVVDQIITSLDEII